MYWIALTVIAVIVAVLRLGGLKGDFFKDMAHLYVGAMGGASLAVYRNDYNWAFYLALFLFLTVSEVVAFKVYQIRDAQRAFSLRNNTNKA